MFLDLEPVFNIDGYSKDFDCELDFSEETLSGAHPFTSPVKVQGRVFNKAGIAGISAQADLVLDIECDRCAKRISYPFSAPVDHVLVKNVNDENNDEFIIVEDSVLNLDELVRDDVFLQLPNKFLCSDDCKGLCPKCGADLNAGPCGCQKEIDPRLEALRQLLEDTD